MKKLLTTLSIFLAVLVSSGQTTSSTIEKEYIEVTGEAEMQVVPDEIYITITLEERYEGRVKVTLDSLEQQLKMKLNELKIDLKNLRISDASSDFVKVNWIKKEILSSKDYTLKVTTASEVSRVFEGLTKIKIQDLEIYKVGHSKADSLAKEVKINAIKNSKEKATYLLAAIGAQIGKPIRIVENSDRDRAELNAFRGNVYVASQTSEVRQRLEDEITFSKIKIACKITARFEIK